MTQEIWKDIKGYEGYYQISNFGKVKSLARTVKRNTVGDMKLKEKILKAHLNSNGYYRINLKFGGKERKVYIHQLVAEAFVSNDQNKKYVNHINNIHTDNRIENLEWVTHSENLKHYWDNYEAPGHREILRKNVKNSIGKTYGHTRVGVQQIDKDTLEVIDEFNSMTEAELMTGIHNSSIHRVTMGTRSTAGGYLWRRI